MPFAGSPAVRLPIWSLFVLGWLLLPMAGCDSDRNPLFDDVDEDEPTVPGGPAATPPPGAQPFLLVPQGGPALEDDGLSFDDIVTRLNLNALGLNDVRRKGMLVFTTPLNSQDGMGDGPFDPSETDTVQPGQRPTLQGNGRLLRLNGLDSQSCNECHTIVSNFTRPPTMGIGGVGGIVQNAMIMPSMIDVADSADDRLIATGAHTPDMPMVFDGVADYNGRVANPPFLFGGGGVELLAKEMTVDLQALLRTARASAVGTVTQLETHDVSFGSITTLPGGQVQLDIEGLGFHDNDLYTPEEIMVVRPFGRKGEAFSMRDFDRAAMQFHFGMQPVEVVGEGVDGDRDGVVDEVTVAEMTALHVFDVTNPRPFDAPTPPPAGFTTAGCSGCHMPALVTRSRFLPLAHPEVPEDPYQNVYYEVDLVAAGFTPAPGGGVYVPLFADLKRHDMGPDLAETFERPLLPNAEFTTARLWGIADTSPYLHDGRATSLYEAIVAHGGEAEATRDSFLALSQAEQIDVIEFLMTLRTPVAPNEELR